MTPTPIIKKEEYKIEERKIKKINTENEILEENLLMAFFQLRKKNKF
jgi:hypothetical protein